MFEATVVQFSIIILKPPVIILHKKILVLHLLLLKFSLSFFLSIEPEKAIMLIFYVPIPMRPNSLCMIKIRMQ